MGTALDALTAQPLNARRPAAPSLPSFELPPPPFQLDSSGQKYSTQATLHPAPTVSVGNLLTPPATNPSGEGTSPLQSTAASSAVTAAPDLPSYSPAYWQHQNPYAASPSAAPSHWAPGANPLFTPRANFSPSLGQPGRNPTTSPPTTEGMSQPYDMNQLPPFQQPLSVPSPSLPTSAVHQQHAMAQAMLSSATSPHPLGPTDPFGSKSHPTSIYGSPHIPNPHQAGYPPPYGGPSSVHQAGLGIHPRGRMPTGSNPSAPGQPPQLSYQRHPWPSYSLPALSGPVMTNVHSPSSQMSLLGSMQAGILPPGFNSGQVASMQHMYGGHGTHHGGHAPAGPTGDRPFKCDQCPQSFNRNHDLKRHKRIHLSVKPFPCSHCDKSFSRKDALKRHILVKGCGKETSDSGSVAVKDEAGAGTVKSEAHSDKDSPMANGHH